MNETKMLERLSNLRTKQEQLKGEQERLRSQLGKSVLQGKDVEKIEGELVRVTVRLDGLNLAMKSGERELENLRAENARKERERLEKELNATLKKIMAGMLEACQGIVQLKGDFDAWRVELQKVADKAHASGMGEVKGHADWLKGSFPFGYVDGFHQAVTHRISFSEDNFTNRLENNLEARMKKV